MTPLFPWFAKSHCWGDPAWLSWLGAPLIAEVTETLGNPGMEKYLYLANILYLFSYWVKDVLALRILAVIAMLVFMPYYLFRDAEPKYGAIYWNIAFFAINVFWIVMIFLERRPPRFTPDQRKLYELAFRASKPREMLALLAKAEWRDAPAGTQLLTKGIATEALVLIHTGAVGIHMKGRVIATLSDGDFVGETSFLTGEPPLMDAIAQTRIRYVAWNTEELHRLLEKRVDLKPA
ncbi:MAG TPA: cyclic nucleotide-binding domain-containing protein, partial [Pirellulaceae bacterium]